MINAAIQSLGLLLFLILALIWAYNSYHVLYKMKKYKHTAMMLFYTSSLTLIIARIVEYCISYKYLFPQKWVVITVELGNISYIQVGVCLQFSLVEVVLSFKNKLTKRKQNCIKIGVISSVLALMVGYIISAFLVFYDK